MKALRIESDFPSCKMLVNPYINLKIFLPLPHNKKGISAQHSMANLSGRLSKGWPKSDCLKSFACFKNFETLN